MRFTACFSLASVNDEIIDRAFQACQQAAVCELDAVNQEAYYKFYLFKLPLAMARADYLSATNPQRDPHAF